MKKTVSLIFFALLISTPSLRATQYLFENYEIQLVGSDRQPWVSPVQLQLGGFETGFTPTSFNLDLWTANWITAGSSGYYDPAGREWQAQLVLTDNTLFNVGAAFPLWVFDQTTGDERNWLLLSDPSWLTAANDSSDPSMYLFGLTGETAADFGKLDLRNALAETADVPSVSSAVPEPSTYSLVASLLLGATLIWRRGKRA